MSFLLAVLLIDFANVSSECCIRSAMRWALRRRHWHNFENENGCKWNDSKSSAGPENLYKQWSKRLCISDPTDVIMLVVSGETNQNYLNNDFSVLKKRGSGAEEKKKKTIGAGCCVSCSLLIGRLLQLAAQLHCGITGQFLQASVTT